MNRIRVALGIARWFGLWSNRRPSGVTEGYGEVVSFDGRQVGVFTYQPRVPLGSMIVVHGTHYDGPEDVRVQHLCRQLAASGYWVACPSIEDYRALKPQPRVFRDIRAVMDWAIDDPARPSGRIGILSISSGSLCALRIAADPDVSEKIGGVITFGGYVDWRNVFRFMLDGHGRRFDARCRPIVYLNLLEELSGSPRHAADLSQAWAAYVRRVWPDEELREPEAHQPIALSMSLELDPEIREMFLEGCCAGSGNAAIAVLGTELERLQFLDPRPVLHDIRCSVTCIHAADDDVIPSEELPRLVGAMPRKLGPRAILTGFYDHAGTNSNSLAAILRELRSVVSMVRAMSCAGTERK